MVTITWIIPALLFFISIFGWEHFVGYRDLLPGQCAVQFLKDPVFNTALIIGYYWTTLVVLFVLYGGIYKTAYDMQKKSEAKQRKMQSMVALSAGAMSGMAGRAAGIGISKTQSTLLSQDKPKSVLPSLAAHSQLDQRGMGQTVTHEGEKSERSSSPAFESDEESTSQPPVSSKKKSSIVGFVTQTGVMQVVLTSNNNRINGGVSTTNQILITSPGGAETNLPKILEQSQLDTDYTSDSPTSSIITSIVKVHTEVALTADDSLQTSVINTSNPTVNEAANRITTPSTPPCDVSALCQTGHAVAIMAATTIVNEHRRTSSIHKPVGCKEPEKCTDDKKRFVKTIGKRLRGKKRREALVEGFCAEPPCTNEYLYMFSYFLCYANSPMNPFCYALANQQFKKTFTRILKGDLHMT
ncbi:muscarinic Acetylcholine Receptor B-type [Carabus blaptoides fortunei]